MRPRFTTNVWLMFIETRIATPPPPLTDHVFVGHYQNTNQFFTFRLSMEHPLSLADFVSQGAADGNDGVHDDWF